MKKFLIVINITLIIPILVLSIIIFKKYRDDNVIDTSVEQRLISERYNIQKELDLIKETNKDKIEKYEKVKSWNEEITSYLD